MQRRGKESYQVWAPVLVLLVTMGACRFLPQTSAIPTAIQQAQSPGATATARAALMPPTWTPAATATHENSGPMPTAPPRPTRTPGVLPSNTPLPSPTAQDSATATETASATATETATPTSTPTVTPTSPPTVGGNLLPNPSFEEGWYHIDGIPELQVANRWQLSWEAGPNPLDEDPAPWVRPEARVLPPDFLPADEHDLFIWDGRQTVKIFKRQGAISFRLTTRVTLQPGPYLLEIFVFPDLVNEYEGEQKVWAPDPLSGEVRLIAGPWSTDWMLPVFGQKNRYVHTFHVDVAQEVEVGAAMRGRWAILNNGWFMDDWRLVRLAD